MARKPSRRRAEDHASEDVGGQLLLSFELLESLLPVGGGELENTMMGPARQQAEQIAHVGERFDLVEPCAREKLAPDRKTNQPFFTSVIVPAGGSATFINDVWVGGDIFDPDCDDFTKVEPNSTFHDDVHYSLMFNSLGLTTRACEWILPLIPDPNTGINECIGQVDCSFTSPGQ